MPNNKTHIENLIEDLEKADGLIGKYFGPKVSVREELKSIIRKYKDELSKLNT